MRGNRRRAVGAGLRPAPPVKIDALRAGDPTAFARWVRLETPRMLAVARRLLGNEDDARDAVQDALVTAFRWLSRFEADTELSTWSRRVVLNASLMKLRARRCRLEQPIDDPLPSAGNEYVAEPAASSEALVAQRQVRDFVRGAIDLLPDGCRTVLLLRDIEQLDTEETAAALGITAIAAKVRLHRARQALRSLLGGRLRAPLDRLLDGAALLASRLALRGGGGRPRPHPATRPGGTYHDDPRMA